MSAARPIGDIIREAFPARFVPGVIAPHVCEECSAIDQGLRHMLWTQLSEQFIKENAGSLPLLSQEAYVSYIAAWLLQAVREPSEEVASMLLTNLSYEPQTEGFTQQQRQVIVEVATVIVTRSCWGADDPSNVESLAAIRAAWEAPTT